MRITKDWLRNTREILLKRLNEVAIDDDVGIDRRFARSFPELPESEYPAFTVGKRKMLVGLIVSQVIPDSICH